MQNQYTYGIGLMSGTSLDGLDLVYVEFKENYKKFTILNCKTVAYSNEWRDKLQNAISFSKENLNHLDLDYGKYLGSQVNQFIKEFNIKEIDFVASHGHTIHHEPEEGITLQIGNGQEIANTTGYKIICDFRSQDVALGGQGAPLVPIGDELLFSEYDYCLNLGGFANISYKEDNQRKAFDICPVNIVLNHYTKKIGLIFDNNGEIASKGKLNKKLYEKLNELAFYKKKHPKSLGLEWVQKEIYPLIDQLELDIASVLRTFIEHAAYQITKHIKKGVVLITGGGAFNKFLINEIERRIENKIEMPKKELIDFKEALIFAFLGLLRKDNKINCLQSVTGASKDHSSGNFFYPKG